VQGKLPTLFSDVDKHSFQNFGHLLRMGVADRSVKVSRRDTLDLIS
jgi:hypothetical protein